MFTLEAIHETDDNHARCSKTCVDLDRAIRLGYGPNRTVYPRHHGIQTKAIQAMKCSLVALGLVLPVSVTGCGERGTGGKLDGGTQGSKPAVPSSSPANEAEGSPETELAGLVRGEAPTDSDMQEVKQCLAEVYSFGQNQTSSDTTSYPPSCIAKSALAAYDGVIQKHDEVTILQKGRLPGIRGHSLDVMFKDNYVMRIEVGQLNGNLTIVSVDPDPKYAPWHGKTHKIKRKNHTSKGTESPTNATASPDEKPAIAEVKPFLEWCFEQIVGKGYDPSRDAVQPSPPECVSQAALDESDGHAWVNQGVMSVEEDLKPIRLGHAYDLWFPDGDNIRAGVLRHGDDFRIVSMEVVPGVPS